MTNLTSFKPSPLIRGSLLQTIIGSRMGNSFRTPEQQCHQLRLGSQSVLMIFEYPPDEDYKPIVILAHGMGGCSDSGYIRRVGACLASKGYGVILMNHRGSGIGMGLSDTLWNGGSSEDLGAVIEFVLTIRPHHPILVIGFSLSGNILLKYLGEKRIIPSYLSRALAVNPPVDLRTTSFMISNSRINRIFNNYYMGLIRNQAQALTECFPDAIHPPLDADTIWDFDVAYTAPAGGYRDVEYYYYKCSANQYLNEIRIPTTILTSNDDPFVPLKAFREYPSSEYVELVVTQGGGHMGYISRSYATLPDKRWMDHFILNWVERGA